MAAVTHFATAGTKIAACGDSTATRFSASASAITCPACTKKITPAQPTPHTRTNTGPKA